MAHHQPNPQMMNAAQQQQACGLLNPGQMITLEHTSVTIERYLNQGGFAHVYLVRIPVLLNNSNQHVLKRIAVGDDATLREVKKEVDVMKLLRGHPNIVQLYDSASYPLGNGTHEVYILMEFCAGGGIIDMMNRRLRERLAEHEILQIFVDVCEGVAFMHNFTPALLHRDLKVENILQASQTSFKLCDFGSTAPAAAKPPSTTAEIRALEADINRHTTMQYRAPEMVDVYLRRPIDEKSDIWALGVLLYKLCYYTTPFEEHGPLAILNAQYKIPPYPVYSGQLNGLIASMLREHGTQRPSVYEVLDAVHRMRGTKSSFHYTAKPKPKPIPTAPSNAMPIPSFVSPPLPTSVGAPYQVRKQDLETIQPMRRGRPSGVPVVPLKAIKSGPVRVQTQPQPKSPVTAEAPRFDAMFGSASTVSKDDGSAWGKVIGKFATQTKNGTSTFDGFADSFDGLSAQMISPSLPPTRPSPSPQVPVASGQRQEQTRPSEKSRKSPAVDAFEGLGVSFGSSSKAPTPTLGSMSSGGPLNSFLSVPSGAGVRSPSAPYLSPPTQSSPGFDWNNNQRRPSFSSSKSPVVSSSPSSELSVEERFPSIESLTSMDPSSFGSISSSAPSPAPIPAQAASALPKTTTQRKTPSPTSTSAARPQFTRQGSALTQFTRTSYTGGGLRPGPSATNAGLSVGDSPAMAGARSQQVTGTAMREARAERPLWDADYKPTPKSSPAKPEGAPKPVGRRQSQDFGFSTSSIAIESARSQQKTPPLPKRPSPAPAPAQPKDWLTGDIDDIPPSLPPFQAQPSLPPLSTSVNKRASAFLSSRNTGTGTAPRETNPPISSTNLPLRSRPSKEKAALTGTRNHDKPPPSATTESSGEEGPEDPIAVTRPAWVPDSSKATNLIRKQVEKEKEQKEGPASPRVLKPLKHVKRGSVYDLVDVAPSNPVASSKQTPVKQKPTSEDLIGTSSSSDHAQAPPLKPKTPTTERTVRTGAARRQSSVGDLLDFGPPSPRERRTASTIDTSPTPASRKFAPSSSSRFNNPPTPSSPTAADRSRPRSMFMSPTTPTSALLSPPVASSDDGTKSRRSIRRGSISDIVSKYEALNAVETGTSSTKSRISKTPSPTTHSRQMSTSTTSGITRSPESKVAKLGSETKAPNSTNNGDRPPRPPSSSKPNSVNTSRATARRTSTSDSSSGGPPSPAAPRVMRKSTLEAPSFTQAPRSSSPVRLVGMQPQPTRSLTSDSSTSPDNNPPSIDSPSPERPYQGVGKLIDQWQKKTEEAEKEQTPIQRRGGPVRRGFR